MSLQGSSGMTIAANLAKTLNTVQSGSSPISLAKTWDIKNGTAADQADLAYSNAFTLSNGGGATTIDIVGGISDIYGDTISMLHVKTIGVIVTPATGGVSTVRMKPGTNPFDSWINGTTPELVINANALMLLQDQNTGYLAVAGTNDQLDFEHGAEDAIDLTVQLVLIGVSV